MPPCLAGVPHHLSWSAHIACPYRLKAQSHHWLNRHARKHFIFCKKKKKKQMLIQHMPLVTKPPGEIASQWEREGGGRHQEDWLNEEGYSREMHINVWNSSFINICLRSHIILIFRFIFWCLVSTSQVCSDRAPPTILPHQPCIFLFSSPF